MAVREPVSPWPFAALVGMAGVFFLYGVAFGVVPWWVGLLLMAAWVAMVLLVVRWFTRRPRVTVLVPVLAVGLWYGVIVGGARAFGWS